MRSGHLNKAQKKGCDRIWNIQEAVVKERQQQVSGFGVEQTRNSLFQLQNR